MSSQPAKEEVEDRDNNSRKGCRKKLALFYIWRDGPLSRGRLADLLSLNLPTVSGCIAELLKDDEIVEEGFATSTGGRKPQLLDVNSSRGAVVGVTFSSRGISSAWADLRGNIQNIRTYAFSPSDGKARTLENIFTAIEDQFSAIENHSTHPQIVQLGLGISGLLNSATGVSNVFPRFEEWVDVPLRSLVEERFGVRTALDSHIAAIALAESTFGNYRGMQNALYVQLGPGLGLGIVVGGQIYRGSKVNVGEFGHTTVSDNGPICYCGNYGCIESVASDYALVQQAEAAIREGVSTRISEFAAAHPGKITPGAIFRAASEGDRFALNLVERVGAILGTGIANLVNLFGPELIILGGTMSAAGDLLLNPICHTLRTKALDRMEKGVEIKTSSFGKEEALKGAVTLALYHHFSRGLEGRIKARELTSS